MPQVIVVVPPPAHSLGWTPSSAPVDFDAVENWMMKNGFRPFPCASEQDGIYAWYSMDTTNEIQVFMAKYYHSQNLVSEVLITGYIRGKEYDNCLMSFEKALKFLKRHIF